MGICSVGADVHVAEFTPLDMAIEQHEVAAAGQIPGEMGGVVEFGPAPLNASVTVGGAVNLAAVPRKCRVRRDDPLAGAGVYHGAVGHAPGRRVKGLGDVCLADTTGPLECDGVTDHAITGS